MSDDDRRGEERPGGGPGDGDPFGFAPDERDLRPDDVPPPAVASDEAPADEPATEEAEEERPRTPVDAGLRPMPGPRVQRGVRMGTVTRAVGGRYMLLVIGLLLGLVTISLLTRRNDDDGAGTIAIGSALPPFAAPIATEPKLPGGREDVNLASRSGQGQAGKHPACSIRNRSVVTSCALLRGHRPLVLVLFTHGMDQCVRTVDEVDRLRRRWPQVATLAVAFGGEHDGTAELVRQRRWTLPVAYDRDGGLGARLGMPVCPFVLFVGRDGRVAAREIGAIAPDALERQMARLAAPPRRPAPATPANPSPPSSSSDPS
ncbi:hypothetical protein [Patulibacter defluvii]|uniref:hypothetical protein n=1 Tax=Patulibacter defluvii TaxID=3095358 RepID=UPI002A75032E|nr:hypothetical protein [Patulibacter sp. DM4]